MLRREMDRVPLWRGPRENAQHVEARQLAEDYAQYLYLPRLLAPSVLAQTIGNGLGLMSWRSESFAFADGYDEEADRYLGLRAGQATAVSVDAPGLLVKPERAWRQLEEDQPEPVPPPVPKPNGGRDEPEPDPDDPPIPRPPAKKRYSGRASLDPMRVGPDAAKIADAVIAHLAGHPGAKVAVSLEIEATAEEGFSEQVTRTVSENGRTLEFASSEFETE